MTKQEFLDRLRMSLHGKIPPGQVVENLQFYEDYINTEIRKGAAEEEVMAGLGDPRLLVLDEPLNAIDIKSVAYFRKLFRELNEKEGVTIILTSHYSQDIQELCRHTYDIHLLRAGL